VSSHNTRRRTEAGREFIYIAILFDDKYYMRIDFIYMEKIYFYLKSKLFKMTKIEITFYLIILSFSGFIFVFTAIESGSLLVDVWFYICFFIALIIKNLWRPNK